MAALELKNLNYKFTESADWLLKDISFKLFKGQLSVLTGPSGSGKSTLLKLIRGMQQEIGGELLGSIFLNSHKINNISYTELGKYIGVVFQNPSYQLHQPRVIDEIMSAPIYQGLNWETCYEKAIKASEGIIDKSLLYKDPRNLSLGQQQRVAIAASLSLDAEIILFDEPFSYFDGNGINQILEIFKKLLEENKTILIITHDIEQLFDIASCLIIINNNGEIVENDEPNKIISSKINQKIIFNTPLINILNKLDPKTNIDDYPLTWNEIYDNINFSENISYALNSKSKEKNNTSNTIISANNISYKYPNGFHALSNIDLRINKGDIIGLLGENGSGKTTLIKVLLNLYKTRKGDVKIHGVKNYKLSNLARNIGYISQNPSESIFETSVYKECAFGPKVLNLPDSISIVRNKLSELGLLEYAKRDPRSLSGGEQRLLNIASTLVNDPEIIVFDEPEFGLDINLMLFIERYIKNLVDKGKSVVIITHKFELASFLCNRIVYLSKGKVIYDEPIENFILKPEIENLFGSEKYFFNCLKGSFIELGHLPNRQEFLQNIAIHLNEQMK